MDDRPIVDCCLIEMISDCVSPLSDYGIAGFTDYRVPEPGVGILESRNRQSPIESRNPEIVNHPTVAKSVDWQLSMPARSYGVAGGRQFSISVIGVAVASPTGWLIRNRPSRATATGSASHLRFARESRQPAVCHANGANTGMTCRPLRRYTRKSLSVVNTWHESVSSAMRTRHASAVLIGRSAYFRSSRNTSAR